MGEGPNGHEDITPSNPLAALSAELTEGQAVGEYRVEHKIGEGGMATVYAATHPTIGKRVAIKVLHAQFCASEDMVERFMHEARAVNQIRHPNIVDIFAFGQLRDGRSYCVMELLEGETLHDRLAQRALSLGESAEILLQLADALGAAHEKGIVHRDLKPENVFLVAVRGRRTLVKLLDFGIAKLADGQKRPGHRTRTGMVMGTPHYLSPEQARARNLDHRTDLYSLGVIMFRMVLGRLPFDADNAMDVVALHMNEPAPRPRDLWPEVPEVIAECIAKLLEKDPASRPDLPDVQSCLAELRDLAALQPELAPPGAPPSAPPRVTPKRLSPASSVSAIPAPVHATPAPVEGAKLAIGGRTRGRRIVVAAVGVALLAAGAWRLTRARAPSVTSVHAANDPASAPATPASAPPPASARATAIAPAPSVNAAAPSVNAAAPSVNAARATGELTIRVNARDATIEIDGRVVGASVASASASVEAEREHLVTVSAPDRRPVRKKIRVAAGAHVGLSIRLAAPAARTRGELVDPFGGP